MTVRIYAMIDPVTLEAKYVGQTRNRLSARMWGHIRGTTNAKKMDWLNGLIERGLRPVMMELDRADENNADELECFWIDNLRFIGADIFNIYAGGPGGAKGIHYHTEESKRRISESRRGSITSQETKDKLSNIFKGREPSNKGKCGRVVQREVNPYRGVGSVNGGKRHSASIGFNGKRIYLGCFKTPKDAAIAYDNKARELWGDDAICNFGLQDTAI
jgi:hypothetical protein